MKKAKRRFRPYAIGLSVVVALAIVTVVIASCGSTKVAKQSSNNGGTKLPPGVTESQTEQSTTPASTTPQSSTQSQSSTPTAKTAATPSASADLVGAHFTIVNATRPKTNQSVISSSARAVPGDYLEVEFTINNTGTNGLVDLSEYSFRLQSPGIAADTYENYYGNTGTYGAYVDTNEISGTLMDYSTLSPVTYKVKVGETIDKVFCFFDLNPETDAANSGVTKDNTSLIIKKVSGTDYGDTVTIPLAGYPD